MRQNPGQRSFSAGEVSPLLYGREDYQRVQSGLRTCRGFIPLRQGAVTRSPGTIHRGATRGNASARLIAFQFAEDDAVVLEFSNLRMRVWRYGVLVTSGGSPYELVTPYSLAAVRRLKFVQSADVIYLVDGQTRPQRLARLALNSWTISPAAFERGPFELENDDEAVTVQASAETGAAITLTGVGSPFVAAHVGGLFRLRAVDDETIPTWEGQRPTNVGERWRHDGHIYEVTYTGGDNTTGVNPPIHREGTVKTGRSGPDWRYISDLVGIVRITAYTNANSVTARVVKRLPPGVVSAPTFRWSEGAWSEKNGQPAAIALWQQRLFLAATPRNPRGIWASAVGGYLDFEPGVEADASFGYTLAATGGSLNSIVWLQPGSRGLHVGAIGEEYSTRASGDKSAPIGPASADFGLDSTVGASPVQPIAPDGKPVMIARDRARVFEMRYAFDQDATQPVELSLPGEHIGAVGLEEIHWQSAPMRLAWLRRSTGDLAVMVHDAAEDVLGWATVPLAGGIVESLCVSTDAAGVADVVTLVVRRVIGGATVRRVEELAPFYSVLSGAAPVSQAVHLFAATVVTGAPFSAVSGLDHLEGESVHVWSDRGAMPPRVVTGGAIELDDAVTRAVVGLHDPTHLIELLDVSAQVREGSALGRQKRVKAMGLRWHRTAAAEMCVVMRDFGRPEVAGAWTDVANQPVPADLVSGWSGVINAPVPSGWAGEVSYRLRPVGGAPMTLLSATAIAEVSGG